MASIAVSTLEPLPGGEMTRGKASGGFGGFGHRRSDATGHEPGGCEVRIVEKAAHLMTALVESRTSHTLK